MSFATLLVYVDPDYSREKIVRLAAQLADKFTSRLIGVSASPIRPPVIVNGMLMNSVTETEIALMIRKLQDKETWFRQLAGASHRAVDWRSELDFPSEFLISQTRCADLIVVGQGGESLGAYSSLDTAGVILKAGRPVLVVPNELRTLQADRVVIGWKDSREARRAITDALPFLREATAVTIAEVCEEGDRNRVQRGIDDVVQYLARHRIRAGLKVVLRREGSNAARLVQLAQDEKADLLVTGAYGHSRFGEWVFGGVTQELLATCRMCCLMSH